MRPYEGVSSWYTVFTRISWPTCGEGGDSGSPGYRALVEQTTHVEEHEEEDEDDPTQGEDL